MDCPTLGAWGRTWLERLAPLERQGVLREQTLIGYECVVRLHFGALGDVRLDELRRPALLAWAMEHVQAGASRRSVVLWVAVLKVCLRDAVGEGLIQTNPAERLISSLRLPRDKPKQRWFATMGACAAFLAAAENGPEWPALALLTYTGLRLGEATGLRWEDVELEERQAVIRRQVTEGGQVTAPKSAAGIRTLDLPGALIEVLRRERCRQRERALATGHHEASPWVLGVEPSGNYAQRFRIRRALRRALRSAGLPDMTPHGLRHSWLSFRAYLGQDARLIQEQAGHSSAKMLAQYTHLRKSDPAAADEVAEAIRPRQGRLFGRGKKNS